MQKNLVMNFNTVLDFEVKIYKGVGFLLEWKVVEWEDYYLTDTIIKYEKKMNNE